jgi:outer membrane protein TolC
LNLGATTPFQVVQDQRDMANARSSEAQAMANYSHARIQFDQALGTTLEANHISITAALAGSGGAPSLLPSEVK